MLYVEGLVWHKHVTLGAPGVWLVPLLQDHYCVLHLVVRKVNPEVGPILSPSQAHLYRAPEPQQTFWGRDLVSFALLTCIMQEYHRKSRT